MRPHFEHGTTSDFAARFGAGTAGLVAAGLTGLFTSLDGLLAIAGTAAAAAAFFFAVVALERWAALRTGVVAFGVFVVFVFTSSLQFGYGLRSKLLSHKTFRCDVGSGIGPAICLGWYNGAAGWRRTMTWRAYAAVGISGAAGGARTMTWTAYGRAVTVREKRGARRLSPDECP